MKCFCFRSCTCAFSQSRKPVLGFLYCCAGAKIHSCLAEKYMMGEINGKRLLKLFFDKDSIYHPFLDSFVTWGYDGGGWVIFGGHQVNIGDSL